MNECIKHGGQKTAFLPFSITRSWLRTKQTTTPRPNMACGLFFSFFSFHFFHQKAHNGLYIFKELLKKKKKLTRRWHRPYVAWKAENIYYIWPFTEKFVDLNSYINQSRLLDWIHKYIIYKWFFFSTPILLFFNLFLSLASAVPFFLLFLSSVFLNFSVEV